MKKLITLTLIIGIACSMIGCESLKIQPYSPLPDGVSISGSEDTGYRVDEIRLKRDITNTLPESIQFCFVQNIPGLMGQPILNSSKTRITAQGRDQVSFITPMTMGTPLNYDLWFSLTASIDEESVIFNYTNLRIKGTWTPNENPLPASQDAHLYVESALDKLNKITDNVISCLQSEN